MPRDLVFISYSRQDQEWLDQLSLFLGPLRARGLQIWDDRQILPGQVWKEEIRGALSRARVAVLLVSIRFLNSEFILNEELPPLLDAAEREGVIIIWIYVGACPYEDYSLDIARYQAAHDPAIPLNMIESTGKLEQVLTQIATQIGAAVQRFEEDQLKLQARLQQQAEEKRIRAEAERQRQLLIERQRKDESLDL